MSAAPSPAGPRVVLGMPAYNRPDTLPQVFESLLLQSFKDFAVVIVDDNPTPAVRAVVDTYAPLLPHLVYEPNPERLGMVGNWRKAFTRARELFPRAEFFAWISDHDAWHPRWIEVLVGILDRQPEVVLAYPCMQRVFPGRRRAMRRAFDTSGITSRVERLRAAASGMTAGNAIYGLFRVAALERAGVFRAVLAPDRQVLGQLMLLGQFRQSPETLWYREVAGAFSYGRQRRMFFTGRVPWHTYLPATVQHFAVMLWDFGVRGRGRPDFGRLAGAAYACAHLWFAGRRELTKGDARWRVLLARSRAVAEVTE